MLFSMLVCITRNITCMEFSLYTSVKHISLNVKPISTPVPLECLKYSSRTEKFQPFFETQISYYQLPFISLRRATSQV